MSKNEAKKINRTDSEMQYMELLDQVKRLEERELNKSGAQAMLPIWANENRGVPNSLLRSALFSGIQSKNRQSLNKEVVFSQKGIVIEYSGDQLNQDDLMVWETLIHLVKNEEIGTDFKFTAKFILGEMGLTFGADNYNTLNETMFRLVEGTLKVSFKDKIYAGSLINAYALDKSTTVYDVSLNPRMINLYDRSQWTAINWATQRKLKRKPLAQYLFNFYSTHKNPLPMKVETIMSLSGSKSKQIAGFKRRLKTALEQLIDEDFLTEYKIEKNLVSVEKRKAIQN